jgi:hypothetical protein
VVISAVVVAMLGLGCTAFRLAVLPVDALSERQEVDGPSDEILVAPSWSKCPQWFDTALRFWPADQWPTIDFLLYRESRCLVKALNPKDTNGKPSYSLFQINAFWCSPVEFYPNGFLQEKQILKTCDDLFTVEKHFAAARAIYVEGLTKHGFGWRSWGLRSEIHITG